MDYVELLQYGSNSFSILIELIQSRQQVRGSRSSLDYFSGGRSEEQLWTVSPLHPP